MLWLFREQARSHIGLYFKMWERACSRKRLHYH
ncbi:hypothetical protein J2W70_004288 [Pseudomonas koreensis]|nr:hypothetical protein [Pseudomonas koreensis]